jgi:GAF domain-containing protein
MVNETARLAALRGLDILDTAPEQHFDHLADLAAEILDTPMALVSLVDEDRQWFKASHGLRATETPRAWSFCDHAVQMGPKGLLVVEDATLDPRFSDNPLVAGPHGFRFYAGAVLTTADGHNLGALCVIDTKPRYRPTDRKLNRLRILADMVVRAFEEKVLVQRLEAKLALVGPAGQIDGSSATG